MSTDMQLENMAMTWTGASVGAGVVPVRVECTLSRGLSGLTMIGAAGKICEDGKERSRAGLERLGWGGPPQRILISISPGDVKIDKTHADLAFCVAMAGVVNQGEWMVRPDRWLFAAEVSLDGSLRPVAGVIGFASAAYASGLRGVVVASQNIRELSCMQSLMGGNNEDFQLVGLDSLQDVLEWLKTGVSPEQKSTMYAYGNDMANDRGRGEFSFDDMHLSPLMRDVALVSASGMHSVLLRGSPGTGKSMFARRLTSVLPVMTREQHMNALNIHSVAHSEVSRSILMGRPPYRAPHHFVSLSAMLGSMSAPGEMSLASGGVLFLDELPEFRRDVLEGLREPLEAGHVSVSRAQGSSTWDAKILLIAATNNCPCGWFASRKKRCECPTSRVLAYRNRLSGPLQDRIDIHINMEEFENSLDALLGRGNSCNGQTTDLRSNVNRARKRALERQPITGVEFNRDIPPDKILAVFARPESDIKLDIAEVIPTSTGTRGLVRCLRVARTIADIDDSDIVTKAHISKAFAWAAASAARDRGEILAI